MAAFLPGPDNLAHWWDGVVAGRTYLTSTGPDELIRRGVPASLVADPDYVPVHGELSRLDNFDNAFFRISPREASRMDPQHRLALEIAWQALEDAGIRPNGTTHRTGVFASSTGSSYLRWILARGLPDAGVLDDLVHGTEPDFLASRISYKLGLTGPALAVQTACSSSLVALHLAVQALMNGDCEQALVVATGATYPQSGYVHLPGGVQSRTGRCLPFDSAADGVVGGSGAVGVVLRLLSEVEPDGVVPHGVILGSATNNDGSGKAGYYAPSAEGQERAIREALRTADVDAASIGYLETHGTGTAVGDPLEWSAASSALLAEGAVPGQIAVGAVKANIGHLDACAGLASLVKTLMVLKTGTVPPVAGFRELNPLIAGTRTPLFVPEKAITWPGAEPRRAGISAFGIGGTNAHVIVEAAAPAPKSSPGDALPHVLLLSASDDDALTRSADAVAAWLDAERPALADAAHTLVRARAELTHRRAVVASSAGEAAALLRRPAHAAAPAAPTAGPPPLIFSFPGQGTQAAGMARTYHRILPGFTAELEACLDAVPAALRGRLADALGDTGFPADELDRTELAQPAIVCLQIAAATALTKWGARPSAVVGHSLGELAAAVAAGVLPPDAAVRFAVDRGRVMQACPPGRMLALACSESQVRSLLPGTGLEIAAVNGPDACVVAGTEEDVQRLADRLGAEVSPRVLRTTTAFHSGLIDAALPALRSAAAGLKTSPATCLLADAGRPGVFEVGDVPDPGVWVHAARSTVRFGDALAAVTARMPGAITLDIGPGRPLAPLLEAAGARTVALGSSKTDAADRNMLAGLAQLWAAGHPLTLDRLTPPARTVRLPVYPFAGPRHSPEDAVAADLRPPPIRVVTDPAEPGVPERSEPATGDVTELVRRMWGDLLGHEHVTEAADFFEAGGDSLLITRLVRALNQSLGVGIPVRALLRARTLGGHVEVVQAALTTRSVS
ncbi:hypothetical protein GCM10010199_50120 [Dactylosporangium roseum]|nr:beta-ketoacyl synthase N-terminal-like domain-containing protein [Dactylosporangium roseum]